MARAYAPRVSPNLRRAAHQALDLILDALAEEQRLAEGQAPRKRSRGPAPVRVPAPARELTPEERRELDRHLGRAGYKKSA